RLWSTNYNGPGNGIDSGVGVAVDSGGSVYLTGSSEGPLGNVDFYTAKYASDGSRLWEARYEGPAPNNDRPVALRLDALGNVYVTGTSLGPTSGNDLATVKYDNAGQTQWVARYTSSGFRNDSAADLQVDAQGTVYVAGSFADRA